MDGLLTSTEVCKLLHFTRVTLYKRMENPNFPQPVRFVHGGRLYFRLSDISKLINGEPINEENTEKPSLD